MAPVTPNKVSLYKEAKAGLVSLFQQIATVFIGFVVMLLVTGGTPSSFVVTLSFCLGIVFVAWSEQRRISKLRVATQIDCLETSPSNIQQEPTSTENSASEAYKNIIYDAEPIEWNVLQWFDDEIVPEAARQIGGWSLSEIEVRTKPPRLVSITEWIISQIPSLAFSGRKRRRKILTLKKTFRIQGANYILRISSVEQNRWSFALETVLPGSNIPEGFELRLTNTSSEDWINRISQASTNQEILSIEVFVPKGIGIIWDIEPRPENYSYEILRF